MQTQQIRQSPTPAGDQDVASLAEALGAGRDQSSGVDNSRALLMTVLGEYMLSGNGSAWTQTLIEALGLVGVRDKTARQTLARLHARGRLNKDRVGRQTRWTLTGSTREILEAGAERIYNFGQLDRTWDQRWAVLLASVPESDRKTRYHMSVQLQWAGFGSPSHGVWLSPWSSREPAAAQTLRELNVDATSFVAEIAQLGDGRELAAQAWNLSRLRRAYEKFLVDTDDIESRVDDDRLAAAELTALVHRWRQFPFADPDLPADLLPPGWPGLPAAHRFAACRAALLPRARRWWTSVEESHTPPPRS